MQQRLFRAASACPCGSGYPPGNALRCLRYGGLALLMMLGIAAAPVIAIPPAELELDRAVIDQAQMISAADRATIAAQLRKWRQRKLMQGAVVLVDNSDGQALFDYGMEIFERWQLGDEKSDNGLLLLVSRDDRKFFLFTGDGLEGVLPDISIKRIERNQLLPAFQKGDFARGIKNALQTIATQLEADPQIRAKMIAADERAHGREAAFPGRSLPLLAVLFFLTLILRAFFGQITGALIGGAGVFASLFFFFAVAWFPALVFAFFFFVFFHMIVAIFAHEGHSVGTRQGVYPRGRGARLSSGGGRSGSGYGGGGGGFSGGGAGGSW